MRNWNEESIQSIFNHVGHHLIKQRVKAIDKKTGECVCYDRETNRRCAVGSLLDVEYYNNEDLHIVVVLIKSGLSCYHTNEGSYSKKWRLLQAMQKCHDTVKPSRWPGRLRAIAKSYGLNIPNFLSTGKTP